MVICKEIGTLIDVKESGLIFNTANDVPISIYLRMLKAAIKFFFFASFISVIVALSYAGGEMHLEAKTDLEQNFSKYSMGNLG